MAGVKVTLIDAVTNDRVSVELPRDTSMSRLIPALTGRLALPITAPDGQPMSYRLQLESGVVLEENDTLSSVGVEDGADITLTVEMEAG